MSGIWEDLLGTSKTKLQIGLATTASVLKSITGGFAVRNSADNADAALTASTLNTSDTLTGITINSAAAGSGADWKLTLQRAVTGMTAAYNFIFPATVGSPGQVLTTDGVTGATSWTTAASTASNLNSDTTDLAFGSSSTVAMFTLPANAIIAWIDTIPDTPFDGTANFTVGTSGSPSKYVGTGDTNLQLATTAVQQVHPGLAADGSSEALIITYSAGGATVGAARVIVYYSVPA